MTKDDKGYTSRIITGNPQRRIDAARADTLRELKAGGGKSHGFPMEWGDRAKGEPEPKSCTTCERNARWMRLLSMGAVECSHVECPHRKTITAKGGDYYDGLG